jgi:PAS domain S-box-containing protein
MDDVSFATALGTNEAFAAFSRLSVSVLLTDPRLPDNPIIYVNDAFERTTGYSSAAAIGHNCRFLQGEKTDKRDVDMIRAAIAEKREVSVDILNYRANGSPFLNRLIIAPILGDDGAPLFFLGLQKELTESDRAADNRISRENLKLIQKLVQRDLAMILNSLREPAAEQPAPLLGRALEALPRRLETLQTVYEEMRQARRVSNKRDIIDLGSLLARVSAAIVHNEGRAGLRYVQNVENVDVTLDRATRIALIVSETLQNAFEHAFGHEDFGRIELNLTRLTGGGMRIIIGDDGRGLPRHQEWPSEAHAGGRLVRDLLSGLDAKLTVVRGAAGVVVLIDVPVELLD